VAYADLFDDGEGRFWITRIVVPIPCRRQGHGTALLKEILADADREGVTLALQPRCLDGHGPTMQRLVQWYRKHGFQSSSKSSQLRKQIFFREPVPSIRINTRGCKKPLDRKTAEAVNQLMNVAMRRLAENYHQEKLNDLSRKMLGTNRADAPSGVRVQSGPPDHDAKNPAHEADLSVPHRSGVQLENNLGGGMQAALQQSGLGHLGVQSQGPAGGGAAAELMSRPCWQIQRLSPTTMACDIGDLRSSPDRPAVQRLIDQGLGYRVRIARLPWCYASSVEEACRLALRKEPKSDAT
jgi:hypothetical protein